MSGYDYRARTREGEILTDRIEGSDRDSVVEALRRRDLLVLDVTPEKEGRRGVFESVAERVGGGRDHLVVFTRQLATMVEAGIPLVRSLRVLAEHSESPRLEEVIDSVRSDVESGASFSEALERRGEVFGRLYVEMVRAGELGGALAEVLDRVAVQLEKEQELRRQVRAALAYPVFVLAFALVATTFMLLFVVPIFSGMYQDLGGQLPLPTRVAVGLSNAIGGPLGLVLVACLIPAAIFVRRRAVSGEGRAKVAALLLRAPFGVGSLTKKVALARVSRTLGSLVSSGVPVLEALKTTANSSGNPVVESAMLRAGAAVSDGSEIHAALQVESVFPGLVVRMVAVGEETGELDAMLDKVADFYESEVDAAVKSLTSIIEPVMILTVGALVGAVIVAMYLPMFRIFELIQ